MVEKAPVARRIDVRLRSLHEHLEALSWYAERFGVAAGPECGSDWDALEAEWRDSLDRFDGAHMWFLAGEMNPEQAERHRQNLALLAESLPLIHQLKIKAPVGALAAWIDQNATHTTLAEPA